MGDKRWVATGPAGLADFAFIDVDVPPPGPGEVTIAVRAAGVNPADLKHVSRATEFPAPVGYEVSGALSAIGPDTEIASGSCAVGDEVLAFRVSGGYATSLTVPAGKVFAKPAVLDFSEAANLLLAGTTAADLLRVARVTNGDTILLHAASGAAGVAVLQLARRVGARGIGTAGPAGLARVKRFGGIPVLYGEELLTRIETAAPQGISVALDAAGTDEAIDASLSLVYDRTRIVTIAAPARAADDGFVAIGGNQPESMAFRDDIRAELVQLAERGELVVPIARTYPLGQAIDALELVAAGTAGGKIALFTGSDLDP
ncbi:zinc-binding dehydrogenase [uncultured Gordonia sp.]|uniref:zinc-binding dehydrogenase n=1 Tax=uncultured Gordonia sp. TaxID=198437 RepID=UPI00262ADAD4|nr:zinc-binding dehydrogenase [uncultured Gordonia sp.]